MFELKDGATLNLAGLPQNPSRLNPRRHPEAAKHRQIYVLDRMLANGYIGRAEHDSEVEKPLVLPPLPPDPPGAFYLDEVRRRLVLQYGEAAVDGSGMTVEIAMDPRLQAAAETLHVLKLPVRYPAASEPCGTVFHVRRQSFASRHSSSLTRWLSV